LVFVLFLGATCQRTDLYTDYTISVKVAAVNCLQQQEAVELTVRGKRTGDD